MAPLTLRQTFIKIAPAWLQDAQGAAFLGAVGDIRDSLLAKAKVGMLSRVPELAADDTLDAIGAERQIPRGHLASDGTVEARAAYVLRLQAAWDAWAMAGTPLGMLLAFYAAGYASVALGIQKGHWYQLDGSQHLVDTVAGGGASVYSSVLGDVANKFWSQFQVLIFCPDFTTGTLPARWGGVVPSSSSTEAAETRTLIRRWKPGFATCSRIAIYVSGRVWGWPPQQEWAQPLIHWGSPPAVISYWTP